MCWTSHSSCRNKQRGVAPPDLVVGMSCCVSWAAWTCGGRLMPPCTSSKCWYRERVLSHEQVLALLGRHDDRLAGGYPSVLSGRCEGHIVGNIISPTVTGGMLAAILAQVKFPSLKFAWGDALASCRICRLAVQECRRRHRLLLRRCVGIVQDMLPACCAIMPAPAGYHQFHTAASHRAKMQMAAIRQVAVSDMPVCMYGQGCKRSQTCMVAGLLAIMQEKTASRWRLQVSAGRQ